MDQTIKNHAEKLRFILVGLCNTLIDFGILFGLAFLGVDKIAANYASTGVALIFSFVANKSFTFKDKEVGSKKQFITFITITLVGLWVLQPIIIWGITSTLPLALLEGDAARLFVAKIIATAASLVWNYLFYSRFVFRTRQ